MSGALPAAQGYLTALGLASAALWGASDFLGGIVSRRANAILAVAIAHGFSLAMLLPIALAIHSPLPTHRTALWALCAGVSSGLALLLFYEALSLGEMGLIAALTGLLTAIVPVVVSFLTEGMPGGMQIAGFALAGLAIWLIAYTPAAAPHPRGLGLAAIAGIGFGGFLVASKYASQGGGLLWPMAYSRLVSTSLAVTVLLCLRAWPRAIPQRTSPAASMRFVVPVATLAGVIEVAGNLIYMAATRLGRLDVAAVLASLYPAGTILLAVWLLKERATRSQSLGMALAMGAVVLISL